MRWRHRSARARWQGVWQAEDLILKRQVAIKFLSIDAAADKQAAIGRFLREARVTASVQHRNVIQISDFGVAEEGQPFMVMELLEGETLRERLSRAPPMSEQVGVHITSLILRGLTAIHDAKIIHRDLKPENIFLPSSAGGAFPKIIDFGVALSLDPSSGLESVIEARPGLIVGTPGYMSPEQARGDAAIDFRADLYGVGVILYEALAGAPPDEGSDLKETLHLTQTVEPPPLRDLLPSINPLLSDFVAQALSRDPERRFASARSMRAALLVTANAIWPEQTARSLSLPSYQVGRSPDSLMPPAAASEAELEPDLLQLTSSMPAADSHAQLVHAPVPISQHARSGPVAGRTRRSLSWLLLPAVLTVGICMALTWQSTRALIPTSEVDGPTLPGVILRASPVDVAPPASEVHPPLDRSLWDPGYLEGDDAGVDADPQGVPDSESLR